MNRVRAAVTSDLAALLAFDHFASPRNNRAATLRRGIEVGKCWVMEVDKKPIGYGLLKEGFFGFDFIEVIYVEVSARRHGIGTALTERLERECKTPKLFTSTNESNAAMRGLLERRGYRSSGIIHNLDADDPELIFVKDLTPTFSN
jgi:GNAT superfamily N-acetyltransferase